MWKARKGEKMILEDNRNIVSGKSAETYGVALHLPDSWNLCGILFSKFCHFVSHAPNLMSYHVTIAEGTKFIGQKLQKAISKETKGSTSP